MTRIVELAAGRRRRQASVRQRRRRRRAGLCKWQFEALHVFNSLRRRRRAGACQWRGRWHVGGDVGGNKVKTNGGGEPEPVSPIAGDTEDFEAAPWAQIQVTEGGCGRKAGSGPMRGGCDKLDRAVRANAGDGAKHVLATDWNGCYRTLDSGCRVSVSATSTASAASAALARPRLLPVLRTSTGTKWRHSTGAWGHERPLSEPESR
jgi:hypothetical protein